MHSFQPFVIDVAHLVTGPVLFSLQRNPMQTCHHRPVVPIGSPIVITTSTGVLDMPCIILHFTEKLQEAGYKPGWTHARPALCISRAGNDLLKMAPNECAGFAWSAE